MIEAVAVEAETPAPPPRTAAQPEPTAAKPKGGIGLHVDLLIPSGRSGTADFGTNLAPKPGRGVAVAVLLEGRYYLPGVLSDLGVSLEVGWYRLGQKGSRENPSDPDFASFSYESSMHILPVLFGPVYRLPLPLPVELHVGAGFAYEQVWAWTRYEANGETVENSTQGDFGAGFFATVEAGLALGPGLATFALRYANINTDLKFFAIYDGAYNEDQGNTGGMSLLAGYRLEL